MFYNRELEKTIENYKKFPVIAILGPRQSGKTTLAQQHFPQYEFLSFDDPEIYEFAQTDPKGFLRKYESKKGLILDEFHHAPNLLSYIKVIADEKKSGAYFILTASQNFLANAAITESLAGRVALLTLLPFSIAELAHNNLLEKNPENIIFQGCYPRLYNDFKPDEFYPSYIRTYIERDVRQLINVVDLHTFQKFMKLCAARVGQLINFSDLAVSCGISVPTVHRWLSILESSYIIFLLQPYHTNFNKRVIKTPKLYFYDTGIVCSLLDISSAKSLSLSPLFGSLFESFIIADFCKQFYNQAFTPSLYFWRDKNGSIEVDCLIERDGQLTPIEIKSTETYQASLFNSLVQWNAISATKPDHNILVYGGTMNMETQKGAVVSWSEAGKLIKTL